MERWSRASDVLWGLFSRINDHQMGNKRLPAFLLRTGNVIEAVKMCCICGNAACAQQTLWCVDQSSLSLLVFPLNTWVLEWVLAEDEIPAVWFTVHLRDTEQKSLSAFCSRKTKVQVVFQSKWPDPGAVGSCGQKCSARDELITTVTLINFCSVAQSHCRCHLHLSAVSKAQISLNVSAVNSDTCKLSS